MKNISPAVVALLLSYSLSGPARALDEVAVWKAEKLQSEGAKMTWPDIKGSNTLMLSHAQGVTLGDKPTGGADQKSVVFSGAQSAAFLSKPFRSGETKVSFLFNPGEAPEGVILRFGRQWQLSAKVIGQKIYLELALWGKSDGMTFARVELKPKRWQEVSASVSDTIATVSCNGQEESQRLSEPLRPSPGGNVVCIGLPTAVMPESQSGGVLPLKGAIADIHVWQ